jgi:hypothetical protein
MNGLILCAALGLFAFVPALDAGPTAGCPECDCCGCCETGSCECTKCGCDCCVDECPTAGVKAGQEGCCGSAYCGR